MSELCCIFVLHNVACPRQMIDTYKRISIRGQMVAKKFTDEENRTANALPLCVADTVDVVLRQRR